MAETPTPDKYEHASSERARLTDEVVASCAAKKVIVAGAGTGKTFLFKKVLEGKESGLTLTFINNLVDDLALDLFGLSEVKTLHGFARGLLKKLTGKNVSISPLLPRIVKHDGRLLLGQEVDFDDLLNTLDETNEVINFYRARRLYYGYYSYSGIIYAALLYLRSKPEKIPAFDQILIDEFQDFNALEVAFIECLSEKSPILIAGDDDQALYQFKLASPSFLRERHEGTCGSYDGFNLPYCSRCTRVIVDATNDVIAKAIDINILQGRVDKPYLYFDDRPKDKVSETFPKIGYAQAFANQVPWFITEKIEDTAKTLKSHFKVLIISPYRKQLTAIQNGLKKKGFRKITIVESHKSEVKLFDGLVLLSDNFECNLGWRIVTQATLGEAEFEELLGKTNCDPPARLVDLVSAELKARTKQLVSSFKKIGDGDPPNEERIDELLDALEIVSRAQGAECLKNRIELSKRFPLAPAIRNIEICLATVQGFQRFGG